MLFNPDNALGATVYDVDTKEKITRVVEIDTGAGEVVCTHQPIRVKGDEIETFSLWFDAIHPIFGGARQPEMFHCYGRRAES